MKTTEITLILVPFEAGAFVDDRRKRWRVPGLAIGIRYRDEERYLCSGASCKDPEKPFDETTIAPIGSITKPFLAHAISVAVQEGSLAWDVPIREYVGDLGFPDEDIRRHATLIDFLSMRVGLSSWTNPKTGRDGYTSTETFCDEVRTAIPQVPIAAPFRKTYTYSQISVAVAALVLETVTGRSWTSVLQQSFEGLGIEDYAFSYREAVSTGRAAVGYRCVKDGHEVQPWTTEDENRYISPAGSLCLPVRDLLCWLGREVDSPARKELFAPRIRTGFPDLPTDFWPEAYGLGWGLRNYRGHRMIYHRGSEWGFRSLVVMIPDSDIQIAIISNRHRNLLIHLLMNHFLDELLGYSYLPWEPLFETYAKQTDQR